MAKVTKAAVNLMQLSFYGETKQKLGVVSAFVFPASLRRHYPDQVHHAHGVTGYILSLK